MECFQHAGGGYLQIPGKPAGEGFEGIARGTVQSFGDAGEGLPPRVDFYRAHSADDQEIRTPDPVHPRGDSDPGGEVQL